jgi:hypothetical protein
MEILLICIIIFALLFSLGSGGIYIITKIFYIALFSILADILIIAALVFLILIT